MRLFRRFRKSIPSTPPTPSLPTVVVNRAPNSPSSSSVLTTTFADVNNSVIKSTNFPAIRHKNEIEFDLQTQQRPKKSAPILLPNKRVQTIIFDENTFPSQYQTSKRRLLTQPPSSIATSDEKLLRELVECQAIIKQQEQQLINGKKDRDQLCLIVDERANELRNIKQKNEQLEQMIRNEQDEKIHSYENDALQMRNEIRSLKVQLEQHQCLINQLNEMKKYNQQLEQENHDEHMKMKTTYEQQRIEHEKIIASLDQALKQSQKQNQLLEDRHSKQLEEFHQHIRQLETKIEEVIKDKALVSLRCGELIEENRRLEKVLVEKVDDYEDKLQVYKEKNTFLTKQIEDMDKQLIETKKQLELVTVEKDETLADMLIAVRVASELRYDAEDRLNKANDDLKRVTERIEHERASVQRRQGQSASSTNRNSTGCCDVGHIKIKEMIQTLEANSRNGSTNHQRPLSHPCSHTTDTSHQRQLGTTTDDAKMLTSTKNDTPSLNNSSHRNDSSIRSITSEQYDEMKSIVEAVCKRMPGSVCKRDALLKWCVERLKKYGISITNFSNSWTDGIAFCALLHSYLPDRIDFEMMKNESKKKRFETAFTVASSIGIVSILDIDEMCSSEWPDWERVMYYVALIFRHFESIQSNETLSPILPIPQATSSPISPTLSSSSSLCASLRSSNSIPTILCSPLQTV